MSNNTSEGKRSRKWVLYAGLSAVMLAGIIGTTAGGLIWRSQASMNRELDRLSAEGRPGSLHELVTSCPYPENAAVPWQEARDQYRSPAKTLQKPKSIKELIELDSRAKTQWREHYHLNRPAIEKLELAAKRPRFSILSDPSQPPDKWETLKVTGEAAFFKDLVRNRGALAFEAGDTTAAAECVFTWSTSGKTSM